MANKYIIHGATYNGDGTSSAQAASNGGVGAWNTITIFEGSTPAYGSLAAGDIVYIRSKTSAGADITRTQAAAVSIGSASATSANWITWILDAGTVWSGIDGNLTYSSPGYQLYVRPYNHIRCDRQYALSQVSNAGDTGNSTMFLMGNDSHTDGILLNWGGVTSGHGPHLKFEGRGILRNWKVRSVYHYNGLIQWEPYSYGVAINPEIELLSAAETDAIFSSGSYGARLDVIGGRIYGAGAAETTCLFDGTWNVLGTINLIGVDVPRAVPGLRGLVGQVQGGGITGVGMDGGAGAIYVQRWGSASSRNDGNFPTLNAFLPNSQSTPWSWWIYPSEATPGAPAQMSTMRLYTDEPATATVTLELLVSNSFTAVTKNLFWIDISYTDNATGLKKSVSTWAPAGSLSTSTATWSNSSYGPISLSKFKISAALPTSIKKDTVVTVTLSCAAKATSSSHIIFMCPDVVLS